MKAADSRHRQKLTLQTLARLDLPVRRRLFPQAVMGPVLMIVREEFSAESSQMLFVERDHMIQQLSTTATHPTLSDSVLPRAVNARLDWLDAATRQELADCRTELRIVIEDDISVKAGQREGLSRSCCTIHSLVGCAVA